MNHQGEIEYLTRLTRPTIALITNAAEAHLAGLGSVEEVARAKGEIFAGLVRRRRGRDQCRRRARRALGDTGCAAPDVVTFGLERPADVRAEYRARLLRHRAVHSKPPRRDIDMRLPLLGRHNVHECAGGQRPRLSPPAPRSPTSRRGLENCTAGVRPPGDEARAERRARDRRHLQRQSRLAGGRAGGAARTSTASACWCWATWANSGDNAAEIHRRVGELAQEMGIQRLYALGDLSARSRSRPSARAARHFDRATRR